MLVKIISLLVYNNRSFFTKLTKYTLTPCIPLSLKGEGEEIERGANAPLRRPFELVTSKRERRF